jgi:hypothetical protein
MSLLQMSMHPVVTNIYLFAYDLLNNSVSSSVYIASMICYLVAQYSINSLCFGLQVTKIVLQVRSLCLLASYEPA